MLYDIVLVAIIVISVIIGIRSGAAKTLLSIASYIIAFVLSVFLAQMLSQLIFDSFICNALEEKITPFINETELGTAVLDVTHLVEALPAVLITSMAYFGVSSSAFEDYCVEAVSQQGTQGAGSIARYLEPVVTGLIATIIAVVLFFVLKLVLRFVASGIAKVFRLPLLRIPDSVLGGVLGLVKGIVIVLAIAVLLKLFSPVIPADWVLFSSESVEKSMVFSFVYNSGLLSAIQGFTYNF